MNSGLDMQSENTGCRFKHERFNRFSQNNYMLASQSILIWNAFGVVELWTFLMYFHVTLITELAKCQKLKLNQFIPHSGIGIAEEKNAWIGIYPFLFLPLTLTLSSSPTKWIHEFNCPKLYLDYSFQMFAERLACIWCTETHSTHTFPRSLNETK